MSVVVELVFEKASACAGAFLCCAEHGRQLGRVRLPNAGAHTSGMVVAPPTPVGGAEAMETGAEAMQRTSQTWREPRRNRERVTGADRRGNLRLYDDLVRVALAETEQLTTTSRLFVRRPSWRRDCREVSAGLQPGCGASDSGCRDPYSRIQSQFH